MTAQKAKQISNKVLVIAASALVLAGYQNCSKIKVADNVVSSAALSAGNSNDVVVATDQHDNVVPVVVEHPSVSADPTPSPTPQKNPPSVVSNPTPIPSPSPVVKNPAPVAETSNPKTCEERHDFCGHEKHEFENAIDVDQFHPGEVELKHECKGSTLVYSASGKGSLKGLNTGSSEGKFVICQVKIDKIEGKKGDVEISEGNIREMKDFKGSLEDGDCAKHDNRDHTSGENNNRDHDKCKLK